MVTTNTRGGAAVAALSTAMALAGCAQMPIGPTVAVMPGANKPFEVFTQDDALCRGWAAHSIGVPGNEAAADRMLASTVTGAAIGALAGAAMGDHRSAGAGAAMGTVIGASVGSNQSAYAAGNAQRRYDIAYQQCMYSKGNLVSGAGYRTYGEMPPPPPPPPGMR
jgi:hypothetical protein